MRYGEWLVDIHFRDVQECDCRPVARCGCANPGQLSWALDMNADISADSVGGIECLECGATWTTSEAE